MSLRLSGGVLSRLGAQDSHTTFATMKKTLIIACSLLAGTALADETPQTLNTATFNRTGTAATDVSVLNTSTDLTLSFTSLSISGENNTDFRNVNANTLTPNINVGNGDNKSWTMTFSLQNDGDSTITINSITLSAFGTNGSNSVQTIGAGVAVTDSSTIVGYEDNDQNKPVDFSITDAEAQAINMGMNGSNAGDIAANRTTTFTLTTPWVIEAGQSVTFDVKAENSNIIPYTSGTYAGINQLQFNGTVAAAVPEPTTATLSLLALAGLAARRRRK